MNIAIVKISGKALDEVLSNQEWINTFSDLQNQYDGVVIVHGAGKNISEWSAAMGIESKFIDGQRVTTERTIEIVAAVQAGILNAKLVSRLLTSGIDAVGLSGIDRGLFVAKAFNKELGYVGYPVLNNSADWILSLLESKTIPVFSSICRNEEGQLMNVNADLFTESLATALNAESVFFVSDVQGVKLNGSLKGKIDENDIVKGIKSKEITDGMIPKLNSCIELLNKGIGKVWIGSKIKEELYNESRYYSTGGTWIVKKAV